MLNRLLLTLNVVLAITACQSIRADNTEVLFVDSQRVECYGVTPQQCLKVKHSKSEDWGFLYSEIEGFQFESGYRYKLLIEIYPIDNSAADSSSIGYRLLEVLERTCDGC